MDSLPQQLILQAVLIFLNAFFAATEIAVLTLNPTKIKKDAEDGSKSAKRLVKMVEEPSGFLSTIQIGITLAGFLGSAFAADNFSEYIVNWVYYDLGYTSISLATLDVISVIIITLILSYITLILGELVPKRVAMQKPYEIAKFTSPVVNAVAIIMKPIVAFLSLSTNIVLKLLRMKTTTDEDSVTEEEIKMMIELGGQKGVLEQSEQDWITNVFEFNDITVEEVMTQRAEIVSIDIDDSEDKILEIMRSSGCSRLPVYGNDDEDIIGILHTKDYLLADKNRRYDFKSLIRQAHFVSENMKASELFKKMQTNNIHMAIVVDEYGSVCGIITMEDLLEEIVGNIYDESDIPYEDEVIRKIDDNKWNVKGECTIKKFEQITDIEMDTSGHYHTMGGVVIDTLEAIPEDGSQFTVQTQGLTIFVTKIENRRVVEMIVEKDEENSGENTEE